MRILVTGASGFAGSFVACALAGAGLDVVGSYRRETPRLQALGGAARLRLIRSGLADAAKLPGPFDAVVHIAATSPAAGVTAEQMIEDNVNGTLALVAAAEAWGSRAFVYFSSVSIHGEFSGPALDETCPIVNPDVYGT